MITRIGVFIISLRRSREKVFFSLKRSREEAFFDKLWMFEAPMVVETEPILVDLATDFALTL